MLTQAQIRTAAKALAQDAGTTGPTGLKLLLTDPGDYNLAISQAVRLFAQDRPNIRVVDQVIATAGFRQVMAGTGAWAGLANADAWADGFSQVVEVYHPFDITVQGNTPLDGDYWRVVRDPGAKVVLEFLQAIPAAGQTVRLVFTRPHTALENTDTKNTIQDADLDLVALLAASQVLQLAAVKATQNTGNTSLPNDVVNRTSQAQEFRNRAKELRAQYDSLVGRGSEAGQVRAASAMKDLQVQTSHRRGFLWHPPATH